MNDFELKAMTQQSVALKQLATPPAAKTETQMLFNTSMNFMTAYDLRKQGSPNMVNTAQRQHCAQACMQCTRAHLTYAVQCFTC